MGTVEFAAFRSTPPRRRRPTGRSRQGAHSRRRFDPRLRAGGDSCAVSDGCRSHASAQEASVDGTLEGGFDPRLRAGGDALGNSLCQLHRSTFRSTPPRRRRPLLAKPRGAQWKAAALREAATTARPRLAPIAPDWQRSCGDKGLRRARTARARPASSRFAPSRSVPATMPDSAAVPITRSTAR